MVTGETLDDKDEKYYNIFVPTHQIQHLDIYYLSNLMKQKN